MWRNKMASSGAISTARDICQIVILCRFLGQRNPHRTKLGKGHRRQFGAFLAGRCLRFLMGLRFEGSRPAARMAQSSRAFVSRGHILYARMNNFSTVQAFLATAMAFTTSTTTTARNISLIVALFGLALSLFYISLGFRSVRVIQFWRAYLRLLESIPGVTSIDSHLFEFYQAWPPARPGGTRTAPGRGPKASVRELTEVPRSPPWA